MGISVGDAILKLGVDASGLNKGMKDAESQVSQSLDKLQSKLKIAAGAFGTIGVAGLAMVASARKINAQLGQTAITIGATTGEMRKMVLETADVTFGIDSVTKTFELLARAGIRNQDEMKASAKAFDALADATGSSAEVVADILIPAFKSLGERIPLTAEEMDKFTWLAKNTTIDLSEFGSAMQYVAMYGADLGVTLDDMIGIMAALEARGITGSAATRLFRTAVTQAADGTISLNEALGVTQDEIDGYNRQIKDATGLTKQYADEANKQYGIIDKLRFMFSQLSLKIGSVLTPLEPLFGVMSAMTPVMIFLSTAIGRSALALLAHAAAVMRSHAASVMHIGSTGTLTGALGAEAGAATVATRSFMGLRGAMMAIPIIAIATGIYFLGQKLWSVYHNWGEESVKFERTWLNLKNTIMGGLPTYQAQMDALNLELAWQKLAKTVKDSYDQIVSDVKMATDSAISNAERVAEREKEIFDERAKYYRELTADRLGMIDDQMMAELRAIDPALAKEATAYNKRLTQLESEDEARQRLQEEDQKRALEEELRGEEITDERRRQLEDQLADIEAGWETQKLTQNMYQRIMASDYATYFESQKSLVDQQLEAQTNAYNTDLEAFKQLNVAKLEDLDTFVHEYHRIMEGLEVAPTVELVTPIGPAPETRERPSNPLEAAQWALRVVRGYQYGGMISEPTLLYGLRSMRPYAIAGEAGTEYVGKAGNTFIYNVSFPGAVIREEQDLHKLSQLVGRELKILQDRTERRTGLRGG